MARITSKILVRLEYTLRLIICEYEYVTNVVHLSNLSIFIRFSWTVMSVFNRFFWSCSSSSAWSIRYNLVHILYNVNYVDDGTCEDVRGKDSKAPFIGNSPCFSGPSAFKPIGQWYWQHHEECFRWPAFFRRVTCGYHCSIQESLFRFFILTVVLFKSRCQKRFF